MADHDRPRSADILREALELHIQRNTLYKSAYRDFGRVMSALFPEGISAMTSDEMNRLMVLCQIVGKLQRYANNFTVGHADSLKDIIVYAAILRSLDEEQATVPF